MSIYIRGMDYTPPRRPDRVYLVYHFDDDIGNFSHSICVTDKLIQLPPHGRLIDADALHEELHALEYTRENEWLDGAREARGVDAARVALLDAPTIIEAEEGENAD